MTRSLPGNDVSRAPTGICLLSGLHNVRQEEYPEDIVVIWLKRMHLCDHSEHAARPNEC